jgi:hypothetical protein
VGTLVYSAVYLYLLQPDRRPARGRGGCSVQGGRREPAAAEPHENPARLSTAVVAISPAKAQSDA